MKAPERSSPYVHPARLILIVSLAPTIGLGIGRFAYSLVLPDMRDALGWSYSAAGFMNTINAAGYLVGALMASRLVKRFGLSAAVRGGTLACIVSLALCATSGNFIVLSFARLLAGLGAAAGFVAGGALAARIAQSQPSRANFLLSLFYAGPGLGILSSGLIAPFVLQAFGPGSWWIVWWTLTLLSILMIDSAVAGTDWYWCRDSRCGANQIRDRAGVDLPRRLFSVRCRIHRIYDFHDRVYPRCRRRCGGAERVLVPDRPKCVRDAVGVEPVAGAQQWRRQHRDHSRCQRGRRGVAAVGAFHRVACHIGDGVRRRILRGGGIDHRLRALQLSPRGMAHGNCGVDDLVWNWPDARADRGRRRHRRHGKPVICPQRLGGDAGGGCDCRGISETAAYKLLVLDFRPPAPA